MQKLRPHKFDVPTCYFKVDKTVGISYSRVIYRVEPRQRHVVGLFNYLFPLQGFSNGLLTDPNGDHINKVFP